MNIILVKADSGDQAKAFAEARGLSVIDTLEMTNHTVRVTVSDSEVADSIIRNWFGESPDMVPGYGYPPGSCIYFWYDNGN